MELVLEADGAYTSEYGNKTGGPTHDNSSSGPHVLSVMTNYTAICGYNGSQDAPSSVELVSSDTASVIITAYGNYTIYDRQECMWSGKHSNFVMVRQAGIYNFSCKYLIAGDVQITTKEITVEGRQK